MATITVELPYHLQLLSKTSGRVSLEVPEPVTLRAVLDVLEEHYPALKGTIRDQVTQKRRAFLRFFACQRDLSHDSPEEPLPEAVVSGSESLLIIGALAGG